MGRSHYQIGTSENVMSPTFENDFVHFKYALYYNVITLSYSKDTDNS